MKISVVSLLLCLCLSTQTTANQHNNGRSMPFIELMTSMLQAMSTLVGGGNSFNTLPYSPAFLPAMNRFSKFNNISNLPMSPSYFNASNTMPSTHNSAQNTNFWGADDTPYRTQQAEKESMNGIWQSLSGDILAIYNNNRFIWSDGKERNLTGYLLIQNNKMLAYVPAKKTTLYFQFYKEPGKFIARDSKARTYTFKRLH